MESRIIVKGEEGDNSVIEFKPKKLGVGNVATAAKEFFNRQRESQNAFRLSEVISEITGLKNVERNAIEKRIEEAALEKLKEIQEEAYQKAHSLGVEEGKSEAFKKYEEDIKNLMAKMEVAINSIKGMKSDVLAQNETQIIDMIFYIAQNLAMDTLEQNPDRIIPVLKECMKSAQSDENILIRMSKDDFESFQRLKEALPKEIEYLKDAGVEAQDDIQPGGCIIETNYGVIDATMDQRVKKVWETIVQKKPKITDDIR